MTAEYIAHYSELPKIISDEFESEQMGFIINTIEPGEGTNRHYQNAPIEEYLYIIEGELDVTLGDDDYVAGEGTVIYLPPEFEHAVVNARDEPVLYLAVWAPPSLTHADIAVFLEDEFDKIDE